MTRYEPTAESVRSHVVPDWFHDSKLGIFVHWGLYSVPAWAPTTGPLHEVIAREGWRGWFARNPYAEWYMNSLRLAGSPTAEYHAQQYGDMPYAGFAREFNDGARAWDPASWADLFARAGARYVVLTTKHHDGFLLWPSATPNPSTDGYHAERDLVGDLTAAVRARGMTMGLYYSGGLDWTFNDRVIADVGDLMAGVPQSRAYIEYAGAHIRELTERYRPAVLWNDIGYPGDADIWRLFADYYNAVPEGLINDRFTQAPMRDGQVDVEAVRRAMSSGALPSAAHFDFRTPEYAVYPDIKQEKWESCRGLGFSFGYNRNETVDDMLSPAELVRSFVDVVSKNGNLLINVGPRGDGTIPAEQAERLLALGSWLETNGAAIYGTRPWERAEGRASDGTPVRFTRGADALYAVLLDTPRERRVTIEGLEAPAGAAVTLLGHAAPLVTEQAAGGLTVELPPLSEAPAHALRIG
jgi:alpha-L-fucosidase